MAWHTCASINITVRTLLGRAIGWVWRITWGPKGSLTISIKMREVKLFRHRELVWQMTWCHVPPMPELTLWHHWGLTYWSVNWVFTCWYGEINHSLGLIAKDVGYYGISYGKLFPVDEGQQALYPSYWPLDASFPVWAAGPNMVSSGLHTESCWLDEQEALPVQVQTTRTH